jgi:transporter family protein
VEPPTDPKPGWQWYALGSAAFAALAAVLTKVGVSGVNPTLATFVHAAVILVVTAGVVTARGEWANPTGLPRAALAALVLAGVTAGLSWLCYFRALSMAPASRVVPIDKASVALVVAVAILFLGEPATWKVVVGGALVVGGVVLLSTN